jgi:DNA-directed RNA polymerase subunit RPC12/RpoP
MMSDAEGTDAAADSESLEIGLANVKYELLPQGPGKWSLRMEGIGYGAQIQVGVSLDGERLEYWPITGVNMNDRPLAPMVPVLIASDNEGFFGRTCPRCRAYFRTEHMPPAQFCPYCGVRASLIGFITANQSLFIDKVRANWVAASQGNEPEVIDLDAISRSLPENRPSWAYSEERQQHCYTCAQCENRFDILGEYGRCPECGTRNWRQVLRAHLDATQARLEKAQTLLTDRGEREAEWRQLIGSCISHFEAMAREIQRALLALPLSPRRRKEVDDVSFQQITSAADMINRFFGFDLLEGVNEPDREFLHRTFNRRHILTHNAGRVDEEYLLKTGDSTVKMWETIRVRSREVARLLALLRQLGENLAAGYDSITAI